MYGESENKEMAYAFTSIKQMLLNLFPIPMRIRTLSSLSQLQESLILNLLLFCSKVKATTSYQIEVILFST